MRTLRCLLPAIIVFGLLASSPRPALARGGPLRQPTLALPPDLPGRERIMAVVADERFRFAGGVFFNARSSLRYEGGAPAVNEFVARLAACPGARVRVEFEDGEPDAAWTLVYDSSKDPHAFRVVVNTRRIARAAVRVS